VEGGGEGEEIGKKGGKGGGGGLEVKRPLETLGGRREDNIKMDFQVIGWCVGE